MAGNPIDARAGQQRRRCGALCCRPSSASWSAGRACDRAGLRGGVVEDAFRPASDTWRASCIDENGCGSGHFLADHRKTASVLALAIGFSGGCSGPGEAGSDATPVSEDRESLMNEYIQLARQGDFGGAWRSHGRLFEDARRSGAASSPIASCCSSSAECPLSATSAGFLGNRRPTWRTWTTGTVAPTRRTSPASTGTTGSVPHVLRSERPPGFVVRICHWSLARRHHRCPCFERQPSPDSATRPDNRRCCRSRFPACSLQPRPCSRCSR